MKNIDIKACLFDLDGTLIDSMWIWPKIDRQYLAKFDIEYTYDIDVAVAGMSFTDTAIYFKERFNLKDSVEKIKNDWENMCIYKYKNEVKPKKGAIEFLKSLKRKNIKTGIATSNVRSLVDIVLSSLCLDKYIDLCVTGCEIGKSKPEPDIYLHLIEKFNVKSENCLAFEDIPEGIIASKRAGIITFAMEDEYSNKHMEKKKELCDFYIEDFMQVYNYIQI